jgi:hypothetical protein
MHTLYCRQVDPTNLTSVCSGLQTRTHSRGWSILLRPQKATGLQKWQPSTRLRGAAIRALRGRRRNMKTSAKDKIKGSFHDMKGTIKEGGRKDYE